MSMIYGTKDRRGSEERPSFDVELVGMRTLSPQSDDESKHPLPESPVPGKPLQEDTEAESPLSRKSSTERLPQSREPTGSRDQKYWQFHASGRWLFRGRYSLTPPHSSQLKKRDRALAYPGAPP